METIEYNGQKLYLCGPTRELIAILDDTLRTRSQMRMATVFGIEGSGKTEIARGWCEQHREQASYIIPDPSSCITVARLLMLIEAALGITPQPGMAKWQRLQGIIQSLRQTPRMLVIDEAHRIGTGPLMEIMQHIHDMAQTRIAFVAMPRMRPAFTRRGELGRRVNISRELPLITTDEIAEILGDLSREVTDQIHHCGDGSLGRMLVLAGHVRRAKVADQKASTVTRIARRMTAFGAGK